VQMLLLGGRAKDAQDARQQLEATVRSGAAIRKFQEIVERQRGNPQAVVDVSLLPRARHRVDVLSPSDGFVTAIHAEAVGLAAVTLGAGRERMDDVVDPGVGFTLQAKVGDVVRAGQPLATVHYNSENRLEVVRARLLAAYSVGPSRPSPRPLILEKLE
jgi:pyrimidine-nucleoside phosphorylase